MVAVANNPLHPEQIDITTDSGDPDIDNPVCTIRRDTLIALDRPPLTPEAPGTAAPNGN